MVIENIKCIKDVCPMFTVGNIYKVKYRATDGIVTNQIGLYVIDDDGSNHLVDVHPNTKEDDPFWFSEVFEIVSLVGEDW